MKRLIERVLSALWPYHTAPLHKRVLLAQIECTTLGVRNG